MSEFPKGWVATQLGEITQQIRGVTYRKDEARADAGEGHVAILRATNVSEGGLILDRDLVYVPSARVRPEQMLAVGDVLVASSSGSSAVVGKSARLRDPWHGAFGAFCLVLRPNDQVDSKYVAVWVASEPVRRRWSRLAAGTNINNLKRGDIAETTVGLPPLAEQWRIVAAIDEQFSRLDASDDSLARVAVRVQGLRASVLESAIPLGCPSVPMSDLVPSDRRSAYGVLQPGPHVDGGVPLVRVGDLSGELAVCALKRIAPSIAERYPRTQLLGGEVMLSIVGTIGRAAVVPEDLAGANVARAIAVIPVRDDVSAKYVALALSRRGATQALTRLAHEVARKTLNLEDVRRFEIPLPDFHEQRRIVDELEQQLSLIDSLRAAVEAAQKRSAALRCAILERAFRGDLVPQDPDDEPASVLLERISAERTASPKPTRRKRVAA